MSNLPFLKNVRERHGWSQKSIQSQVQNSSLIQVDSGAKNRLDVKKNSQHNIGQRWVTEQSENTVPGPGDYSIERSSLKPFGAGKFSQSQKLTIFDLKKDEVAVPGVGDYDICKFQASRVKQGKFFTESRESIFIRQNQHVISNPGPNKYDLNKITLSSQKFNPVQICFSKSPRERLSPGKEQSPGPGEYMPEQVTITQNHLPGVKIDNRTKKFYFADNKYPGVGKYNIHREFEQRPSEKQLARESTVVVKPRGISRLKDIQNTTYDVQRSFEYLGTGKNPKFTQGERKFTYIDKSIISPGPIYDTSQKLIQSKAIRSIFSKAKRPQLFTNSMITPGVGAYNVQQAGRLDHPVKELDFYKRLKRRYTKFSENSDEGEQY